MASGKNLYYLILKMFDQVASQTYYVANLKLAVGNVQLAIKAKFCHFTLPLN